MDDRRGGKKGGNYFSGGGDDDEQRRRRNAEERLGKTPGHGSSKPGKDSGMNRATTDHEALIVEDMRKQKEAEHLASRPKATMHQSSAMSDFDKAMAKAKTMSDQEEFDNYLVARGYTFTDDELDLLYAALQK